MWVARYQRSTAFRLRQMLTRLPGGQGPLAVLRPKVPLVRHETPLGKCQLFAFIFLCHDRKVTEQLRSSETWQQVRVFLTPGSPSWLSLVRCRKPW